MPAYHAATIIDPAKAQTPVQKPLAIKEQQLQTYLSSLHATNLPNTTLQTPQTPVPQLLSVSTPQFMPTAQTPLPTYSPVIHISQHSNDLSDRPSETKEPEDNKKNLSIKTAELQKELAEAKLVEAQQQTAETSKSAHQNTLALEKQLKEIADQKASLEQQLLQLKKQLDFQTKPLQQPTTTPPAAQVAPAKPSPRLVTKLPPKPVAVVMKTPDFPNLVTGIIKDPRGNVLSNILIEILDKDNNPVRAFKTNAMGQFASATTLTNGDYIVTFEDPRGQHTFANIAISAKGEILAPLDITSQDARDELRKELFS